MKPIKLSSILDYITYPWGYNLATPLSANNVIGKNTIIGPLYTAVVLVRVYMWVAISQIHEGEVENEDSKSAQVVSKSIFSRSKVTTFKLAGKNTMTTIIKTWFQRTHANPYQNDFMIYPC